MHPEKSMRCTSSRNSKQNKFNTASPSPTKKKASKRHCQHYRQEIEPNQIQWEKKAAAEFEATLARALIAINNKATNKPAPKHPTPKPNTS
jgi:hypothetical protein